MAGHEPPVIVGVSGVRSLEPGGLVLGLFAHATYRPDSLQLDPGDLVIVCSDGVTDESSGAFRPGSVRWACVESSHGLDPETLVDTSCRTCAISQPARSRLTTSPPLSCGTAVCSDISASRCPHGTVLSW